MKKTKLTDMKITHVSYVRKGANKKEFFLMKSDDDTNFEKEINLFINKSDEEKKLVYGVVYSPNEMDTHGDFTTAEEIEKAAHGFLEDSRNIDLQHNFQKDYGSVVESYISPIDFKIEGEEIKKGAWVLVTKANNEVWESIKKGDITGYSMAGRASKTIIEKTENITSDSDDEYRGFFNTIKSFFSGNNIQKSGKSISNSNMQKLKNAYEALSELINLNSNNEGENEEMRKEDIEIIVKSAVNEAVKPINEKINMINKESGDIQNNNTEDKKSDEIKKEDIEIIIKSVLNEAVNPINERLENIEKARGLSKQLNDELNFQNIKKSKDDVIFKGIQM